MKALLEKISQKQHVIWDWNGTLLNDVHHAVNIINEILHDHELPKITQNQYKDIFGFPVRSYYQKLGFNMDLFEELSHRFVDTFMDRISDCSLFPHTQPVLGKIKSMGKRQSILSATDQENLNWMMKRFELENFLDDWFGIGDKFASSKLEQGKKLIQKSEIDPKDTVLIADTDHDLEVGKELGIEVILLSHGHQSEGRLKQIHSQVLTLNPYHHPNGL